MLLCRRLVGSRKFISIKIVVKIRSIDIKFIKQYWEMFNSIKMKFLKQWNITEQPYDTFKYLFYDRVRFYASACGSDVTNIAYRYSLRTYIFVTSTVLFIFFSAYTIYAYEDHRDKVKCLITFPFGLQVSEKF